MTGGGQRRAPTALAPVLSPAVLVTALLVIAAIVNPGLAGGVCSATLA